MAATPGRVAGIVSLAIVAAACDQDAARTAAEADPRVQAMLDAPRSIDAGESPWIEELTWMEVRDLIADGFTTAIVPTGGIEENGPYLATGKHNFILEATCPEIARRLGNALCAPIVGFVPEGKIDPPSGAMLFPGSFSVRESTYVALLEDIAGSLRQHGFTDIVLIGDSGGNQDGMETAATNLNRRWAGTRVRAHFVREFYDPGWELTERFTADALGVEEMGHDGHHDDIWVTAMMMVADPETVRHAQRVEAGRASINGVSIENLEKTVELGRRMIEFRAEYTAGVIRERLAR